MKAAAEFTSDKNVMMMLVKAYTKDADNVRVSWKEKSCSAELKYQSGMMSTEAKTSRSTSRLMSCNGHTKSPARALRTDQEGTREN